MEAKYYTPEIEEFYSGFKYERDMLHHKMISEKSWKLEKYKLDASWLNNEEDLSVIIAEGGIRVKYLDKEDVESLRFENYFENYTEGNCERGWFRKQINKDFGGGYYTLIPTTFHGENSWLIEGDTIILKEDGKTFDRFGMNKILFNGVIKNLSEFKILLKRLAIETKTKN